MIVYIQYYHQFYIYLGCHDIPAITIKNIYGYILRKTSNHQLENLDMLHKDSEVGTQRWTWFCSHLYAQVPWCSLRVLVLRERRKIGRPLDTGQEKMLCVLFYKIFIS